MRLNKQIIASGTLVPAQATLVATRSLCALGVAALLSFILTGASAYAAAPLLFSTLPPGAMAGTASVSLTAIGQGFLPGAQINFNGTSLNTSFISATRLQAVVPGPLLATAGVVNVTVTNPDNTVSAACQFIISNPVPVLTGISPGAVTAGTPFTLTITGSGLVSNSAVIITGAGLPAAGVPLNVIPGSGTQLTATSPGINVVGADGVHIFNPSPGGGTSAALPFSVTNAAPIQTTASVQAANIVYNASATASIISCILSNKQPADNVTCSAAAASFADTNAGVNKAVTATGITLGGLDAGKYALTSSTAFTTATVLPRPITVTGQADKKTYDGTTASAVLPLITAGALQGNDTASFKQAFNDKNAGTGKILIPSGLVNDGNGGLDYSILFVPNNNGAIAPKRLTITAQPNVKTYDRTTSAAAVPLVEGLAGADTVSGVSEVYDTPDAGTGKALSVAGFTVNDFVNGNDYTVVTIGNYDGVINKAPLVFTAADQSMTFGFPPPGWVGAKGKLTNLPESMSGAVDLATADGISAAGGQASNQGVLVDSSTGAGQYPILAGIGDPNHKIGNYDAKSYDAVLTINPYPLTGILTASPQAQIIGGKVTFTVTLPVAAVAGEPPAKKWILNACPGGAASVTGACLNLVQSPLAPNSSGGLTGSVDVTLPQSLSPGIHTMLAVFNDAGKDFSLNTPAADLQVDAALPYHLSCDRTQLYISSLNGSAHSICTLVADSPGAPPATLDLTCDGGAPGDCIANPGRLAIGQNSTVRFFYNGGDHQCFNVKASSNGVFTAPQQVCVDTLPVTVNSGLTSNGNPLYSAMINSAGKAAPGAFDYNFSFVNQAKQPADFRISVAGRTIECSSGACTNPQDGFYVVGGNPAQVFNGRPGEPRSVNITASGKLWFIDNAGQVLNPPLKGGRTLVNKIMVTGTAPIGGQIWLQVNSDPDGAAKSTFHYVDFSAGLTFNHIDLSDPNIADLIVSDIAPQMFVLPAHITSQYQTAQGPVTVNFTGSLNAIVLTGSKGQAIPGLGGRDYVPVIVTGGTLTGEDPSVGATFVKIGESSGIIEEGANHTPGDLDVFPFETGTGDLVLEMHGTSTLPNGLVKLFNGAAAGELSNIPPLPSNTLQSPTLWQALNH